VLCGDRLNLELARQWRDQLWAEAVAAYRAGEPWWLDDEQEAQLASRNRRFETKHPWHDMVLAAAATYSGEFSTARLLEEAVKKPAGQWTKGDEMAIAEILRGSKAYRKAENKRTVGGVRTYFWSRIPLVAAQEAVPEQRQTPIGDLFPPSAVTT
jgi:putative DNA primase/helicase